MLFNSYEFLFVFLPVTLLGFFFLGTVSRTVAIRWLILASLVFYGCWRPVECTDHRAIYRHQLHVSENLALAQ